RSRPAIARRPDPVFHLTVRISLVRLPHDLWRGRISREEHEFADFTRLDLLLPRNRRDPIALAFCLVREARRRTTPANPDPSRHLELDRRSGNVALRGHTHGVTLRRASARLLRPHRDVREGCLREQRCQYGDDDAISLHQNFTLSPN